MTNRTRILALIILTSLLGLSGCVYRPTIQQGNILSEADLHSVRQGMSQTDVINRLGNPVLRNVYADGQLVYIYTLQPNRSRRKMRQLLVTFRSGRVVSTHIQSTFPSPSSNRT